MLAATRSQTMNPNPDVVVFFMPICPRRQPQEAEPPRRCGDEFIRALTEINTTSGDEASQYSQEIGCVMMNLVTIVARRQSRSVPKLYESYSV